MFTFSIIVYSLALISIYGVDDDNNNHYDIVIVGGGFSGLYTAYRLGQSSNGSLKIAIVEQDEANNNFENTGISKNGINELYPSSLGYNHACLGGRIQDYPYKCNIDKDNNPHCPSENDHNFPGVVFMGDFAMRYKTVQGNFFLAQELGFQDIHDDPNYEYGQSTGQIGEARGHYFEDGQDLLDHSFTDDLKYGNLISDDWVELYLSGFKQKNLDILCDEKTNPFHHIRSYYANTTGSSDGVELLEGSIRFKNLWSSNDAQAKMEWIDGDEKYEAGWAAYPYGGMSEFIRRLYQKIIDNKYADIYCNWRVQSIVKQQNLIRGELDEGDKKYIILKAQNNDEYDSFLRFPQHLHADKVILTVSVSGLHKMDGLVAQIASSIFANIFNPIDVVTCSQQFEEKWWVNLVPKQYPLQDGHSNDDDMKVDTWFSRENCMQQIEAFNSDYLDSANIIRSLYVDESKCYEFWKSIIIGSNYDFNGIVADEIRRRHAEFFGVDIDSIPKAIHTRCEMSDEGWHHLGVGASYKIGNNPHKKVEEWAYKPLRNEDIFMCGESWTVRHGWTDGCRSHCDIMMNKELNVDTEYLKQWEFSLKARGLCSSVCGANGSDSNQCTQYPDQAILRPHHI